MSTLQRLFPSAFLSLVCLWSPVSSASLLLGHFEYECFDRSGCLHSSGSGTEANLELEIYPGRLDLGTYVSGSTTSLTWEVEPFINTFFTSGLNPSAEPMVFLQGIVGGSGFGTTMTKNHFLNGRVESSASSRLDGGYDVVPINGIDLALNLPVTHIKFDLFNLQIMPSNQVDDAVALQTHFRVEFLNDVQAVPAPGTMFLFSSGILGILMARRRAVSSDYP